MFTGIIEALGEVTNITQDGDNYHFTIKTDLASEAYIDQSICHNGACLTVVAINRENNTYIVTAIKETLAVTNLKHWEVGTLVNLERSMKPNGRLDGHFVQGHVDTITKCLNVEESNGSWYFTFGLQEENQHLLVNKGSVTINGTSLTVILSEKYPNSFRVAIIPYTFEHTNFKTIVEGSNVNIEFDILGKYIAKQMNNYKNSILN